MFDLFEPGTSKADKINAKVVYKQILSCLEDKTVVKDVPILKSNASVALVILNTVKAIKFNKQAFRNLAHQAAEIIIAIWQSYKKAKVPVKWLSPPLQDISRGLQETLNSMLVFFEEEASTNVFFRIICGANDIERINKYHQRLTVIFDKFQIQSHLATKFKLLQLLEKQNQLSSQIKHGKYVKNVHTKRVGTNKLPAKTNLKGSTGVSHTQRMAESKRAKVPKKHVKKTPRKSGKQTPNPSSQTDEFSEDEDEDEVLPSLNRSEIRSPMNNNLMLPSTSPYDWPWGANRNFTTTAHWTLPSCPSITFSSSGKNVTINQGLGLNHFLNVGGGRSVHYRH